MIEAARTGNRSHDSSSGRFSPGVEDVNIIDHPSHIQKLHAENEYLLSRWAAKQKLHMDLLLKLCTEMKNTFLFEAQRKRLTKRLAKDCVVQKMLH